LRFGDAEPIPEAHWKLAAIKACAAATRPLAWIDDAHNTACLAWTQRRPGPSLLVPTDPAVGLQAEHVDRLLSRARGTRVSPAR
jgi:hypothetical protein